MRLFLILFLSISLFACVANSGKIPLQASINKEIKIFSFVDGEEIKFIAPYVQSGQGGLLGAYIDGAANEKIVRLAESNVAGIRSQLQNYNFPTYFHNQVGGLKGLSSQNLSGQVEILATTAEVQAINDGLAVGDVYLLLEARHQMSVIFLEPNLITHAWLMEKLPDNSSKIHYRNTFVMFGNSIPELTERTAEIQQREVADAEAWYASLTESQRKDRAHRSLYLEMRREANSSFISTREATAYHASTWSSDEKGRELRGFFDRGVPFLLNEIISDIEGNGTSLNYKQVIGRDSYFSDEFVATIDPKSKFTFILSKGTNERAIECFRFPGYCNR